MNKSKKIIARDEFELAKVLGLSAIDGAEIKFRSDLNDKIISVVKAKKLTHAEVAKIAKTSRTRITAILNRHTKDVSTDLMLRILASLGYGVKLSFYPYQEKKAA